MDKECFLCGRNGNVEPLNRHHIFGGSNRKWSEKFKLVVHLCAWTCHNGGKNSVHMNKEKMQQLHEYGQNKFMKEQNANVDEFRKIFGKNYLDKDEDLYA